VAVARQELHVLHRQVELVAARILEREALVRRAQRRDGLEPGIAPDAVVRVDDEVAGGQRRGVGEEVLLPPPSLRSADEAVAEDVLLGDHREPRRLEARLEFEHGDMKAVRLHVRDAGDLGDAGEALVLQQARHALAGTGRVGRDDDGGTAPALLDVTGERSEEIGAVGLPLGREAPPRAPARVDHAGAERLGQGDELADRPTGQRGVPCGLVEIEQLRRDRLVGTRAPGLRAHRLDPRGVLLGQGAPAAGPGGVEAVVEGERRARQVVEDRLEPVVEERQPVFEALVLAS
jgi:hypothetical protein